MKKVAYAVHVNAYGCNYNNRVPGHKFPSVHVFGHTHEGSELQSFTFHPDCADALCDAIKAAATAARLGADNRDHDVDIELHNVEPSDEDWPDA